MSQARTDSETRRQAARAALDVLGSHRGDRQRLGVQCPRSHHVAFVYDTEAGPVFWARTGPHAHGSKDFVDTGHHGAERAEYVDLLEAARGADDTLPAWCDCGPQTLSRSALLGTVHAGERMLHLP